MAFATTATMISLSHLAACRGRTGTHLFCILQRDSDLVIDEILLELFERLRKVIFHEVEERLVRFFRYTRIFHDQCSVLDQGPCGLRERERERECEERRCKVKLTSWAASVPSFDVEEAKKASRSTIGSA